MWLMAWAVLLAVTSARAVWRGLRRRDFVPAQPVPMLVVRPCASLEPELTRTLLSTADARLPPGSRVVHAVATDDDPALDIARAAAAELRARGIDADVVITLVDAPNQKAAQLARVIDEQRELVVCADSDDDLATIDLGRLALPDGVDAAWAPPVEVGEPRTVGDRASSAVLCGSLHAFPLLAGLDDAGVVGKLLVVRASALREVGGFAALTGLLGEDVALGRALRARGGRVLALRTVVPSRMSGRPLASIVKRYARWLRVVRSQRPALMLSYPAFFFATPFIVMLGIGSDNLGAAFLAGATRLGVALAARHLAGDRFRIGTALADALLADGLLFAAWLLALTSRRFSWRGRPLAIGPGGRLETAR